jgi:hypothetical protein
LAACPKDFRTFSGRSTGFISRLVFPFACGSKQVPTICFA